MRIAEVRPIFSCRRTGLVTLCNAAWWSATSARNAGQRPDVCPWSKDIEGSACFASDPFRGARRAPLPVTEEVLQLAKRAAPHVGGMQRKGEYTTPSLSIL